MNHPDAEDIAYCADEVRRGDRDRYLAVLLAPRQARAALFALHAFALEVSKTHAVVSDPMLGRIRLQWWRESLDGLFAGVPRRHAVLTPLEAAVRQFGLERPPFDAIVDGHDRDLDLEPFADLPALESYCDMVEGNVIALAMAILGDVPAAGERALAREAGIAVGIASLLRRMARSRRSGPLAVPADLAQANGLDPATLRNVPSGDARLRKAAGAVAKVGEAHLASARTLRREAQPGQASALLPAATAGAFFRRLRSTGVDFTDARVIEPAPGEAWRLLLASALHRF